MYYEEKLKLAKEALASGSYDKKTIEYIFPELRESEDEGIRKDIVEYIKSQGASKRWDFNTWIAWLEKQGEPKLTPKFKIGDTIHKIGENTVFPMTIEKIEDGDYVCNNSHSFVNIKFQDDYELVEQKSAWSEEDENMIDDIIRCLKRCGGDMVAPKQPYQNKIDWLKSLKDKVKPQTKQEWSEGDDYVYNEIIKRLADKKLYEHDLEYIYTWLKTLKHNRWKPSEKQMEALWNVIPNAVNSEEDVDTITELSTLYDELKNL